jgi:signal transduction histidine kinase
MIDPQQLDRILRVDRFEHGYVALLDSQGQLVFRYPEMDLASAQYDEGPVQSAIARVLEGEEVAVTLEIPGEGKVMAGFVPIPTVGWIAMAGRAEEHVIGSAFEEMWRELAQELVFAAVGLVLVLLVSQGITRPIRILRRHAWAIGRGELDRRVDIGGPAELADLASAFNRMAGEVQAREKEIQTREKQVERAYQEAREAIRLRDEFLAVAAHELRTPITSLRGYAQLVLRQLDKNEQTDPKVVRQALMVIDQQSRKLTRRVSQLFEVSDIMAGGVMLSREKAEIAPLLNRVIQAARISSPTHTFALAVPDTLTASVDVARFQLVVAILIDIAVKYSPEGGHIDIAASLERGERKAVDARTTAGGLDRVWPGGVLCLTLSEDRGIISPAAQATIREHLAASRLDRYSAVMDLDLYVSRHLVDVHGGKMAAEFSENSGIKFLVSIPTE